MHQTVYILAILSTSVLLAGCQGLHVTSEAKPSPASPKVTLQVASVGSGRAEVSGGTADAPTDPLAHLMARYHGAPQNQPGFSTAPAKEEFTLPKSGLGSDVILKCRDEKESFALAYLRALEVIGDNIVNANTPGFKRGRTRYHLFSGGGPPCCGGRAASGVAAGKRVRRSGSSCRFSFST